MLINHFIINWFYVSGLLGFKSNPHAQSMYYMYKFQTTFKAIYILIFNYLLFMAFYHLFFLLFI